MQTDLNSVDGREKVSVWKLNDSFSERHVSPMHADNSLIRIYLLDGQCIYSDGPYTLMRTDPCMRSVLSWA